jgi:3-oxoacyl-[acyl-carrier-protein] synthase III
VTALEAVTSYLPDCTVPVEELAEGLELSRMQVRLLRRYLGFDQLRFDPDSSLLDLLRATVGRLDGLAGREHLVRYVLHARSMPVAVPYPLNPLHELCGELGLGHACAFTVSQQACATALATIDMAGRLLAADGEPGALALVLAGEKAFTRDAQHVPGTTLFAEAGGACLVSAEGTRDRLLAYASNARGEFDGRLEDLPDLAGRYEQEYPEALAEVMAGAARQAGLDLTDLGLLVPHNVNLMSWQRLCRRIGFPVEQAVLDNIATTGHAFCADFFINYRTAVARGLLRQGEPYLVAAAGQGATFSAMIFEH